MIVASTSINTDVSSSIGIEDMSPEEALLRLSITEVVVVSVHDEGLEDGDEYV